MDARGGSSISILFGVGFIVTSIVSMNELVVAHMRLEMTVAGDDIVMPVRQGAKGECEPCQEPPRPGDPFTILTGPGGARRDRNAVSVIIRADRKNRKKAFILCHRNRQYSDVTHFLKAAGGRSRERSRVDDDLLQFKLIAPAAMERGRFGEEPTETIRTTVRNALRAEYRVTVTVTAKANPDDAGALELAKLFNALSKPGGGWAELIPFEHGLPVLWEEAQKQPQTEFIYREELVSHRTEKADQGNFEVPKGYTKVPYDQRCMPVR